MNRFVCDLVLAVMHYDLLVCGSHCCAEKRCCTATCNAPRPSHPVTLWCARHLSGCSIS